MPSDNGSIGPPGIYARRVEGGTYRNAASDIAGARAIRRTSTVGAWQHIRDCPRRSGLPQTSLLWPASLVDLGAGRRTTRCDRQGVTNRWTNFRAVSATSRQPLSIVSELPRSGILTISVMPSLRAWRLNEA